MKPEQDERVKKLLSITEIHDDFPKPGIKFLDVLPIVSNPEYLNMATDMFVEKLQGVDYSKIFML